MEVETALIKRFAINSEMNQRKKAPKCIYVQRIELLGAEKEERRFSST